MPGFSGPGSLEVVFYIDRQFSDLFDLQGDDLSILEWIKSTVVRACGNDVACLNRMDRRDPFDATWNQVSHVICVEVLLNLAVVGKYDL